MSSCSLHGKLPNVAEFSLLLGMMSQVQKYFSHIQENLGSKDHAFVHLCILQSSMKLCYVPHLVLHSRGALVGKTDVVPT